jgi:hypothetical protein
MCRGQAPSALLHQDALSAVAPAKHVLLATGAVVITQAYFPASPAEVRTVPAAPHPRDRLASPPLIQPQGPLEPPTGRDAGLRSCNRHLDDILLAVSCRRNDPRDHGRLWYYVAATPSPCSLVRLPTLSQCSFVRRKAHLTATCTCCNIANTNNTRSVLHFVVSHFLARCFRSWYPSS